MTDARSLIMGSGSPGFVFNQRGDSIVGQIITEPKAVQQKIFGTSDLAYWPSGDPKMQTVFQVQTGWRAYEGITTPDRSQPDNGVRTIYLKGKFMEKATKEAILAARAEWLDIGGWIEFCYVGDDMTSKAPMKPKMFTVRYQPPQQGQQRQATQPSYTPPAPPQPQQTWQQPGWRPEATQAAQVYPGFQSPFPTPPAPAAAMPSHHGHADAMPGWAQSAPTSSPPLQAAPTSAPPAPTLSTLDLIRQERGAIGNGFDPVEPAF